MAADKEVLKDINSYSDIADFVEGSRSNNMGEEYSVIGMPSPEWTINNALIYTAGDIITDSGLNKDALINM